MNECTFVGKLTLVYIAKLRFQVLPDSGGNNYSQILTRTTKLVYITQQ